MNARNEYYIEIIPDIDIDGTILDVGCGDGKLMKKISKKYNINTIGLDIKKSKNFNESTPFILGDGTSLSFKSNVFSLITSFSVIEHIPEELRSKFYGKIYRTLRKGGYLIIQHPNRFFPIEQHSYLPFIGYLPSRFHEIFFHDYCRVPTKNKLIKALTRHGFELSKEIPYGVQYVPLLKVLERIGFFKIFPFGYLIVLKKPREGDTSKPSESS